MVTCEIDADCASGDHVCLIPHCEEGVCNNEIRDGLACDDGLFCTENDTCDGETCGGAARVCPDQGPCALGVCDEANDVCGIDPLEDGDACDDSVFCTVGETCTAGACGNGTTNPCDSTNPCETGSCDAIPIRPDDTLHDRPLRPRASGGAHSASPRAWKMSRSCARTPSLSVGMAPRAMSRNTVPRERFSASDAAERST